MYPFSLIYGLITSLRNWAFDRGILKSKEFSLPIIAVGNLNVGGTGKSPQIEYLIRLLQSAYAIAVLSRGYGRKTRGFLLGSEGADADQLGDEPLQFYRKFRNVCVAVDENRVHGIEQIQSTIPDIELILLDDAFQHRYVQAGLYVLLTAFDDLYVNDVLLPAGNLRESKRGARRANVVVVTKCPPNLSEKKRLQIKEKLNLAEHQELFFTCIKYQEAILGNQQEILISELSGFNVLLVTGIANSNPLEEFLNQNEITFEHIKKPDHQKLGKKEVETISRRFDDITGDKKLILTTEKDYVRNFLNVALPVYYLPIVTDFVEGAERFNTIINDYVRKNKRNS